MSSTVPLGSFWITFVLCGVLQSRSLEFARIQIHTFLSATITVILRLAAHLRFQIDGDMSRSRKLFPQRPAGNRSQ